MLLVAALAGAMAINFRRHLTAALGLGVLGYAVGGVFLMEFAPDVAMVQFLVETLTTILVIVIIGRIRANLRRAAIEKLWKGRSYFDQFNLGLLRDVAIAGVVGVMVFLFALTALTNRPQETLLAEDFCQQGVLLQRQNEARSSIASFYLCHSYKQLGATDVVAAIVTDYRGMDTYLEIAVIAVASLGVLTLLSRGLQMSDQLAVPSHMLKMQAELEPQALDDVENPTQLTTPFTALVARFIMPAALMIAVVHINYGGLQPGDGFTAGALLGLATALWFVVFGYEETKARLRLFAPHVLLRSGLLLAMLNALLPILLGKSFLSYVDYGALLGLKDFIASLGLKFSTTLVFEVAICFTVFGGVNAIMETIAHPVQAPKLEAQS